MVKTVLVGILVTVFCIVLAFALAGAIKDIIAIHRKKKAKKIINDTNSNRSE